MEASAPGKVLILGGYLIVESPNVGVSIGVSARFTARVVKSAASAAAGQTTVSVVSPQFHQLVVFACTTAGEHVSIRQLEGPGSPFLNYAVLYAVAAARLSGDSVDHDLTIQLLADNDFYSQRNYLEAKGLPVSVGHLRQLPPHLPLVGEVSKTGLGSSAAMTTSVVACLLSFFRGAAVEKECVHRVAQIAHCVSQGKIGSGFDVFTAVYGTCVYRRFPADIMAALVKHTADPTSLELSQLARCVDPRQTWTDNVAFHLPSGIQLMLGDVHCGGSSTPGMVGKVMAWYRSVAEDKESTWRRLQRSNERYITRLRALVAQSSADPGGHAAALEALRLTRIDAHVPSTPSEAAFIEAAKSARESRVLLRELGECAGVPVEPPPLTELLDDTAALPGVFAVGCPGAGGFDAVFALVIGESGCAAVERFWETYSKMKVCPLLVREDPGALSITPPASN